MSYVVPQTLVHQELNLVTSPSPQALPAFLAGGHAHLVRYTDADEKPKGYLGEYVVNADTPYAWPDRPAGSKADLSYTRLFMEKAALRYFERASTHADAFSVGAAGNQLTTGNLVPFTNAAANHSASFGTRGVKVGDAVKITYPDAGPVVTARVTGFKAKTAPSQVLALTDDTGNAPDTTEAFVAAKIAGATNCMDLVVNVASSDYRGFLTGVPTEIYTIRVIQGSTGGDLSTARLLITSASGKDDQGVVAPAAPTTDFAIGSLGVLAHFVNDDCDPVVPAQQNLVVGQTWTVTATGTYIGTSFTSGGTYTGAEDDIYLVEVTKGGDNVATVPEITVRTSRGLDFSGPHQVTTGAIAIGTKGVTITPAAANKTFTKGDQFIVGVVAAKDGLIDTLTIDRALTVTGDVSVALYIVEDAEITSGRLSSPPNRNWTSTDTELTVLNGMTLYTDEWQVNGAPVALPVESPGAGYCKMYLHTRYWRSELGSGVYTIQDSAGLSNVPGVTHPDNPLKYGLYKALQNNGDTPVAYTAICEPDDPDSWVACLDLIENRRDTYGLVPLTRNKTVLGLFQAHVDSRSTAEAARWRTLWVNAAPQDTVALVSAETSNDDAVVLARVSDDPATSGVQNTIVTLSSNNANFLTAGVLPGDKVRYRFVPDGFGNVSYSEYTVDAVLGENMLRLTTGLPEAYDTAERVEIWRNLNASQHADELAKTEGFGDRRVRYIWPDTIEADGYTVEGYYLCAAVSALAGSVVPHQSLTRLEINGFTATPRTNSRFSATQLNTMAGGGVWIVLQDETSGSIITRHAVTTGDTDDAAQREEMITRNLDSMSFLFYDVYNPYIGISNVTETALSALRAETRAAIKYLESANFVDRLGSQLVSGTLVELRQHATLVDRVVIVLDLELPFPMNNVEVFLRLVA